MQGIDLHFSGGGGYAAEDAAGRARGAVLPAEQTRRMQESQQKRRDPNPSAEPASGAGSLAWIGTGLMVVFVAAVLASAAWRGDASANAASLRPGPSGGWSAVPLVRHEVARGVVSFLLGLLLPVGLSPLTAKLPGRWRFAGWGGAMLASWGFVAWWMRLEWGHLPSINALLLPWAFAAAGGILAAAALRGWKWLVGGAVALMFGAAAVLGGGWLLVSGTLGDEPPGFERVRFDTNEKNLLVTRIRESRPAPDEPRILVLREDELSGLLNSVLLRVGSQHKARLSLAADGSSVEISLVGPASWERRFLNATLSGDARVVDGHVTATVTNLTLNGMSLPWPATGLAAGIIETLLNDEPTSRSILDVVSNTRTLDGEYEVLFDAGKVGQDILPSLIEQVWGGPNVAGETQVYVERLLDAVAEIPPAEDRFGRLMQEAFTLARERSVAGNPQLENRAAIFGLAIVLGHEGIEQLVGQTVTPEQRKQLARTIGTARLRDRQDWARHFLVSAATELLADRVTGDTMGVFKESIDSQAGGSGFSFADLLANMAGMRFAERATASEQSARRVQMSLSEGFRVDSVFPFAADLPEGIPADSFERDYGGVEGAVYARLVRELEYRLQEMPSIGN